MQGSTEAYLITEAANHRPNQLRIFQHVVTLPCSRKKLGLQPGLTTPTPVHLSLRLGLQCSVMTFTLPIKWETEVDKGKALMICFSGLSRAGLHGACPKVNMSISPSLHTCTWTRQHPRENEWSDCCQPSRTIQDIFLVCKTIIRTQELSILGHYCVSFVFCISNNEQNSSYLLIHAGKTHSVCREGGKPL